MDTSQHKFLLNAQSIDPCVVEIHLLESKKWTVIQSDTKKCLYDFSYKEIVSCQIVDNVEKGSYSSEWDDEDDEGIMDDKIYGMNSKVQITFDQKLMVDKSPVGTGLFELFLEPMGKDTERGNMICNQLIQNILKSMLTESTDSLINSNEKSQRILVLSNPKGGKGDAPKYTQEIVLPLIKDRNIDYDLLVTLRANQASHYVKNFPRLLQRYSSIAIISGDGLVYEIYQGLMGRPDWEYSCKLPIAIIPGGSGNGLAKSVTHFQNKEITSDTDYVRHCATNLVDGTPKPMDMSCIQTSNGDTHLSFLSFSWGFAAEVDIESEKIRFLGGARFAVWSVYKLLQMGSSKARVSFKIAKNEKSDSKDSTSQTFSRVRRRLEGSETSTGTNNSNDTGIEDSSCANLTELSDYNKFPLSREVSFENNKLQDILREPAFSTDTQSMKDWTVVEDKFVMVMLLSKPWMAKDICMAPQFHGLDDGVMWLLMIRKGISRKRMLQVMMSFWDGSYSQYQEVEAIPVTAFRLEPLAEKGIMMVDGEEIESGPIQAEVLPSFANIVY